MLTSKLSTLTILFVCLAACSAGGQKPDGNASSKDTNKADSVNSTNAVNAAPTNSNEQKPDGEQKSAVESGGPLRVGAMRGSDLIDATVIVKNLATGKEVSLRTYTNPQTNPRTFELPTGRYSVRVIAVKPPGLSPQEFTVEVKAKETVERNINF